MDIGMHTSLRRLTTGPDNSRLGVVESESTGGGTLPEATKKTPSNPGSTGTTEAAARKTPHPDDDRLRAERLAAIGRLASSISGELRQPLSVIRNAVHFLNIHLGTSEDDKVRRHLGIMLREINTATGIVDNLTTLSSPGVPDREISDVEIIVAAAVDCSPHPPGIQVESAIPPQATLYCDPIQIRQALSNIIVNGIQAISERGKIRIVCRETEEDTRIEISDNGRGMPEEIRIRVLEPLFTTSPQLAGLGMTVVRSLVGANGGTVEIQSEPGKGTTVMLRFPRHGAPAGGTSRQANPTQIQSDPLRRAQSKVKEQP